MKNPKSKIQNLKSDRLLVIGLDGATFDLIHPWVEQGHLPTIGRLLASGTSGELESTMPPVTAAAWASFMTGKNPGGHGVFDFFRPHMGSDEFELINRDDIAAHSLWEYLSEAGLKVGVLNVPVTYPPRAVNGYLVPGLLSPDQGRTTYPPAFLQPYRAELGSYRLTPHLPYRRGNEAAYLADLLDVLDTQIRYLFRLAQDHPTNFLMVHFLSTDTVQHTLWKHQDPGHAGYAPRAAEKYGTAIRDVYTRIDSAMGRLLETLPAGATTIVMSDHGFGPLHQTINLNNFFIQTGLMTLKRNWGVRIRARAFRYGLTPLLAKRALMRLGLAGVVQRLTGANIEGWSEKIVGFADVDWSRTLAYAMGHFGQVYLNLKGREPGGIVEPEAYQPVRQQVIKVLRGLQDPLTKKPLAQEIIPAEDVASGPYRANGPDLHLIMDNYRTIAHPMFAADGNLVAHPTHLHHDSGTHRRHGIFIAAGPQIRRGETIAGARIIDLAPTILHLMGLPIPADMDGRPLVEALLPGFLNRHPLTYQPGKLLDQRPSPYSAGDQAKVEERLRALGYLG